MAKELKTFLIRETVTVIREGYIEAESFEKAEEFIDSEEFFDTPLEVVEEYIDDVELCEET